MRLRDLEDAAVEGCGLAAEERDERVALTCADGDAEREDLEDALDAIESRAFEAVALRAAY